MRLEGEVLGQTAREWPEWRRGTWSAGNSKRRLPGSPAPGHVDTFGGRPLCGRPSSSSRYPGLRRRSSSGETLFNHLSGPLATCASSWVRKAKALRRKGPRCSSTRQASGRWFHHCASSAPGCPPFEADPTASFHGRRGGFTRGGLPCREMSDGCIWSMACWTRRRGGFKNGGGRARKAPRGPDDERNRQAAPGPSAVGWKWRCTPWIRATADSRPTRSRAAQINLNWTPF